VSNHNDDAVLVKLTLDQGSQYFGKLVKRYSDYIYGLGMRLSGGNDAQAKDVSQQAFIKAFQYLGSFNPNHKALGSQECTRFRNWLTGIATNCYADLAKREAAYLPLTPHVEQTQQTKGQASNFSEFNDLIRSLTIEERQIVTLKYVYEYKVDEIAGMLSMKAGTVKSKMSRAISRLREVTDEQN